MGLLRGSLRDRARCYAGPAPSPKIARMVEEGKNVSEGDFLVEFDGSEISRRSPGRAP